MVSFQRTTETTVLISEFIIYRLIKHETFASTNLDSYLFFLSLFVSSKRENSFYYRVHAFWLRSRCSTCFTLSDALLYYNVGKPTPYIYVVNSVTVTLTLWQHLSHRTNQLVRRIPMPDWHWWRGQCFFSMAYMASIQVSQVKCVMCYILSPTDPRKIQCLYCSVCMKV